MEELYPLIIAISSPILLTVGGLFSWFLKTQREELRAAEERALERRARIYMDILEPLLMLFTAKETNVKMKEKALSIIPSLKYRQTATELTLFGSDAMVSAYADLMQSFYKGEHANSNSTSVKRIGALLLEMRKDVYSRKTRLKEIDMLKFMITDIENL